MKHVHNSYDNMNVVSVEFEPLAKRVTDLSQMTNIDYNEPLYKRPWTTRQTDNVLMRWYSLDMQVNDLNADDLKLLQEFYRRFQRLDDTEQMELVKTYHHEGKPLKRTARVLEIKHKVQLL